LLIVPHAGYGKRAFYDWRSKSLQFYYFGDQEFPVFTCLSHDIIAHLTGMAVLDGIRPRYKILSSPQTAAFQEFIGNLTALLLSFNNIDIRHLMTQQTSGNLGNRAEGLGWHFASRPNIRSAFNNLTMSDVIDSLSPKYVSQVMAGAMCQVLESITLKYLSKDSTTEYSASLRTHTMALRWAIDHFRRMALQPLDLCPPCDIQFIDYAKAVIRNDILTNPVDDYGYRQVLMEIFHQRKLCTCAYQSDQELPPNCTFQEAIYIQNPDFVYLDINLLTGSKTAAYYFLNDNQRILHIPASRDVTVLDLYDNNKLGTGAERLSRQFVLVYTWQEDVVLTSHVDDGLVFGEWEGKTLKFDCGGTLVFDERGNLLSWFRKPGTEHITETQAQDIRMRKVSWDNDLEENTKKGLPKPTQLELDELADWEIGRSRKETLLVYLSQLIQRNLVSEPNTENRFLEDQKPINAIEEGGFVHFEITPHLREIDYDTNVADWNIL
jgi:hypothetical protein